MGQDQSTAVPHVEPRSAAATSSEDGGVQLVRRNEHGNANSSKDNVETLVERSKSLPLPQPLLPPPPVKDDVSSALQGAQMMHELRNALGGLLLGIEESPALRAEALKEEAQRADRRETPEGVVPPGQVDGNAAVEDSEATELGRSASSIDEFSKVAEIDTRAEQEQWARLGIDQESVDAMIEACTAGAQLGPLMDQQEHLLRQIAAIKDKSVQLRLAMDRSSEEARRTTRALDKLDRIHVSLADVQENLELAVATANILGASHFAHDDEMCSFKNFLRHNPPAIP